MKLLLTIITTFFLLSGCGNIISNNTVHQNGQSSLGTKTTLEPNVTTKTKNQPYTITTVIFSKDNIKVQYPQIKGLKDDSKEKTINNLIKNDVLKNEVEEPIKFYENGTNTKVKLTLDVKYKVTMKSSELLSVVYTGDGSIEGAAFPTKDIHALTIDLKNVTKLKLSDFTVIDSKLAQKIKKSTAVTNDAVKNDGMDKSALIGAIQDMDDQTIIKGLQEEWAYNTFYITPNSLVVSIEVPHVLGDYALIELPGQYTKKYTKK